MFKTPFHGVDVFVSVCVLLFCLLYVAVCSTSLVCDVRSDSKTLTREPPVHQVGERVLITELSRLEAAMRLNRRRAETEAEALAKGVQDGLTATAEALTQQRIASETLALEAVLLRAKTDAAAEEVRRLAIDSPCECEHNNPDSLDARLFFTEVLAVAPAVTMDEASSG